MAGIATADAAAPMPAACGNWRRFMGVLPWGFWWPPHTPRPGGDKARLSNDAARTRVPWRQAVIGPPPPRGCGLNRRPFEGARFRCPIRQFRALRSVPFGLYGLGQQDQPIGADRYGGAMGHAHAS